MTRRATGFAHGRRPAPAPAGFARPSGPGADRRAAARGFTLVEVLVALVIVGVALGASLRAVGGMARQNEVLRAKLYAGWSASNRIAELRAARVQPAIGQRSFQCPQGRLALVCDEEVKATGNRYMRRVEITVYSDASRREWLTTVSTVLANGSDM